MKVAENVKICQFGSVHFCKEFNPKEATERTRKGSKFPCGPNLVVFMELTVENDEREGMTDQ
jgi:hypothetical protein